MIGTGEFYPKWRCLGAGKGGAQKRTRANKKRGSCKTQESWANVHFECPIIGYCHSEGHAKKQTRTNFDEHNTKWSIADFNTAADENDVKPLLDFSEQVLGIKVSVHWIYWIV